MPTKILTSKQHFTKKLKDPPGSKVKFAVTDIDGVLRGKVVSKEKLVKSLETGIHFCNVIFGWDMSDALYDNTDVSGWHTGYRDALATIDTNTLRHIPWDHNCPMVLGDFTNSPDEISSVCPRALLKKVAKKASDMGFKPVFANEFEWFNFNETPNSLRDKNYINPEPLTPGMFGYSLLRSSFKNKYFNALFNQLERFDIPLEGLHTETGEGVYEAAIAKSHILEAADRATLFKTAVKELAYNYDIMASFMAKWSNRFPGCSGHIHQSLWDPDETKNLFYDPGKSSNTSSLMEHYIAGQLHCLPFIMPMYAPTINSYKRYVPGSWAPVSISWGYENRTAALRIINHYESSTRVENRVPGSDANPYLSMAASLASGLYGIEHELELSVEVSDGNEYANKQSTPLPESLVEATNAMKNSDIPEELFGETFCSHFITTREWETRQHQSETDNWEMKRYFEII